ncbi:MAG: PP2C family serine/threonine-protein phosphatase, partial [Anaerolineae bacterium]
MSQIITGSCSEIGNQQVNCDYAQTVSFSRPNRDRLAVAIVADGGRNKKSGQMLAQIARDGVMSYLKRGNEESINDLLTNAIVLANRLVMSSFHTESAEKPSCSLAVAITVNNQQLYIANVGSCQIHLVRNHKVRQLTLDHTHKNIAAIQGETHPETSDDKQQPDQIAWAVGLTTKIQVDTGFHIEDNLSEKSYQIAQLRGAQGIPLIAGDSIIVCSDGLGRSKANQKTNTSLILDREIVRVLDSQVGNRGARGLVSFALGRGAADNVSVALLQRPNAKDEQTYWIKPLPIWQNSIVTAGGAIAALLTICLIAIAFSPMQTSVEAGSGSDLNGGIGSTQIESIATNSEERAKGAAQAKVIVPAVVQVASPTPIPTVSPIPTQQPTAIPTEIVHADMTQHEVMEQEAIPIPTLRPTLQLEPVGIYKKKKKKSYSAVYEDQLISGNRNIEVQINDEATIEELIAKMEAQVTDHTVQEASLYALWGSSLEFTQIDKQVELRLFDNSDVLIETGVYTDGAQIEVRTSSEDVT